MKISECRKIKKKCSKCNEVKNIFQFPKRKNGSKDGYRNICKKCYYESKKKHKCVCIYCNNEFMSQNKEQKFCSNECYSEYKTNNKKGKKTYINVCIYCNKTFETIYKNQKYCSHECSVKERIILTEKKCIICNKTFKSRKITSKYCSNKCKHEGRKDSNKKIYIKCEICGTDIIEYKSQIKNQKHIYCSRKCKDIGNGIFYSGENSARWNKDRTMNDRIISRHYAEYNQWRLNVYKRDNYTCQCCGDNKGGNLRAHHIFNYSEHEKLRTDVNNGITLCKTCHKEFHDIYGYTNNTKEQLDMYINSKRTLI